MDLQLLRKKLLNWYSENKRDLPWRHQKSAYAIWLSEIMLQQTTVATVIPYYLKFLKKFPTIETLAHASENELLKEWAGLGYYNRIRNFQTAAIDIVENKDGHIPESYDELLSLKGFGPYTAAAVSSIAFNKPHACVDGNIMRVISRVNLFKESIHLTQSKKYFFETAETWIDRDNPGDFNQAMMELGAIVCTPKNPKCDECPISIFCQAKKYNRQQELPTKIKPNYSTIMWDCFFITNENNFILLRQRKDKSVMKNMWEIPYYENKKPNIKSPVEYNQLLLKAERKGGFSHAIMNERIKIQLWVCWQHDTNNRVTDSEWVPLDKISTLPLTTVTKKALRKMNITL